MDFKAISPENIADAVWNFNLLQLAIFYGNEAAIHLLLGAGTNVNEVNECGTALWIATYFNRDLAAAKTDKERELAARKQVGIIELLLKHNANINQTYDLIPATPTPLHVTISNADYHLTRLFLLNGARTDIQVSSKEVPNATTADKLAQSLKAQGSQAENIKKIQQLMATVKSLAAANNETRSESLTAIFTGQQHVVAALTSDFNFTFAYLSEIAKTCTKASKGEDEAAKSSFHQPQLLEWALSQIKTMLKQSGLFNRLNEEQCTSILKLWQELSEYNAKHNIRGLHKIFASDDKKLNFLRKLHKAQARIDEIHGEEQRAKLARQKAEEEAQRKAKEEAEAKRKAQEETERKAKEETERKAREEAKRKADEESARIQALEATQQKAQEEAETKRKAEEDLRKEKEEAERKTRDQDAHKDKKEKKEKADKNLGAKGGLRDSTADFDLFPVDLNAPPPFPLTPVQLSATPLLTPGVPSATPMGDPLGATPTGAPTSGGTFAKVSQDLAGKPPAPSAPSLFAATQDVDNLFGNFDPRSPASKQQTPPPLPTGAPPSSLPLVPTQGGTPSKDTTANLGSPVRPTPPSGTGSPLVGSGSPLKKAPAKKDPGNFLTNLLEGLGGNEPPSP